MEGLSAAALARAREGDTDAFRVLVEHYSRPVFRLAFRMTGNEADAEDVVQEAFLRAYRGLGKFDGRSQFSTWLYRIATNVALDHLRKRKRHEDAREPVRAADSDALHPAEMLPATDPSPDRLVLSVEMRERVEVALSRLAPRERAAFVLRHFEGMSIAEIGRALNLRSSATKNNIFRAVQKLRRELAPLMSTVR